MRRELLVALSFVVVLLLLCSAKDSEAQCEGGQCRAYPVWRSTKSRPVQYRARSAREPRRLFNGPVARWLRGS